MDREKAERVHKRVSNLTDSLMQTMADTENALPSYDEESIAALVAVARLSSSLLFSIQTMGGNAQKAQAIFFGDIIKFLKQLNDIPEHLMQEVIEKSDMANPG